jgi:hypothetical protein
MSQVPHREQGTAELKGTNTERELKACLINDHARALREQLQIHVAATQHNASTKA